MCLWIYPWVVSSLFPSAGTVSIIQMAYGNGKLTTSILTINLLRDPAMEDGVQPEFELPHPGKC